MRTRFSTAPVTTSTMDRFWMKDISHTRIAFLVAILTMTGFSRPEGAQAYALMADLSRGQLFSLDVIHRALLEQGANFALPLPFTFPADARDQSQFGIDVSHHNFDNCSCAIDWVRLTAQKVRFVFIKASQGDYSYDP